MNSVIETTLIVNKIESSFASFFKTFQISSLFRQCRIEKKRGIPCPPLFSFVFLLIFTGKNLYRHFHPCSLPSTKRQQVNAYGDDTVYRFLQDSTFHWKKFLTLLTKRIIRQFIQPLNEIDRVTVLTIDDSLIKREESHEVELLSKHFDHTSHQMVKGFNMLTLGYDDGSTFLPIDFTLMSAPKHYVNPWESHQWKQDLHPSSLAYQRRNISTLPKPEVVKQMLSRAIQNGITANYVLFDSWFSINQSLIKHIQKDTGMDVICMLKRSKAYYGYQKKLLSLPSLFEACQKRYGKKAIVLDDHTKLFGSLLVSLGKQSKRFTQESGKEKQEINRSNASKPEELNDFLVKVVFVENRNKKSKRVWLALLSTDISLSDEEIIRIYGKRWDIEVFFKSIKSLLRVEKEYQLRNFDSINAHISIVCCRYCYLSWLSRKQQDPRTLGDLFYQAWDEMEDIRFMEALERIIKMFTVYLMEALPEAAMKIQELFTSFIKSLPCYILRSLDIISCGS
jgi:hypothetical protein